MEYLEKFPYIINYKKGKKILWLMPCQEATISFQNQAPKFLDLITYMNCNLTILNSLPSMMNA